MPDKKPIPDKNNKRTSTDTALRNPKTLEDVLKEYDWDVYHPKKYGYIPEVENALGRALADLSPRAANLIFGETPTSGFDVMGRQLSPEMQSAVTNAGQSGGLKGAGRQIAMGAAATTAKVWIPALFKAGRSENPAVQKVALNVIGRFLNFIKDERGIARTTATGKVTKNIKTTKELTKLKKTNPISLDDLLITDKDLAKDIDYTSLKDKLPGFDYSKTFNPLPRNLITSVKQIEREQRVKQIKDAVYGVLGKGTYATIGAEAGLRAIGPGQAGGTKAKPQLSKGKLITPVQTKGKSPLLTVAGRKGRFNFEVTPVMDGTTPGARYAFDTNNGERYYFQLESKYQGGRWEDTKDAETLYNKIRHGSVMEGDALIAKAWGSSDVAKIITEAANKNLPFDKVVPMLRGVNTNRQISLEPFQKPQLRTAPADKTGVAVYPDVVPQFYGQGLIDDKRAQQFDPHYLASLTNELGFLPVPQREDEGLLSLLMRARDLKGRAREGQVVTALTNKGIPPGAAGVARPLGKFGLVDMIGAETPAEVLGRLDTPAFRATNTDPAMARLISILMSNETIGHEFGHVAEANTPGGRGMLPSLKDRVASAFKLSSGNEYYTIPSEATAEFFGYMADSAASTNKFRPDTLAQMPPESIARARELFNSRSSVAQQLSGGRTPGQVENDGFIAFTKLWKQKTNPSGMNIMSPQPTFPIK